MKRDEMFGRLLDKEVYYNFLNHSNTLFFHTSSDPQGVGLATASNARQIITLQTRCIMSI